MNPYCNNSRFKVLPIIFHIRIYKTFRWTSYLIISITGSGSPSPQFNFPAPDLKKTLCAIYIDIYRLTFLTLPVSFLSNYTLCYQTIICNYFLLLWNNRIELIWWELLNCAFDSSSYVAILFPILLWMYYCHFSEKRKSMLEIIEIRKCKYF